MPIGKIGEFDIKNGAWSSYADRLESYFKVNGVDDALKLPTLISLMGDEAYELLVNLASPKKPSELTYSEATDVLCRHLQPAPSVLAERYRFRQRRQRAEEKVSEYVAELKKLARHCKFGEVLSENLRDQFVCGIGSDVIRQRLFAEADTLAFSEAVRMASSLEAAERDAAAVEARPAPEAASAVHLLRASGRGRGGRARRARGSGGRPYEPAEAPETGHARSALSNCRGCGATSHGYGDCRFRDYVCSLCKRTGHLRRVCTAGAAGTATGSKPTGGTHRSAGVHFGNADSEEPADQDKYWEDCVDLYQLNLGDYKPVSLPICINDREIIMEIDTGTAISCISEATYLKHFTENQIIPNDLCIKFYDGSKIRPLGIIKPMVKYRDIVKELELFVIKGGTTSLLGRQWLGELGIQVPILNCNNIVRLDNDKCGELSNEINILLRRYKQLFDGSLGRFTGGRATLRVREGAVPVYHRARPMAFATRERVDAELDAMLAAGVIEPVDSSDWASPLVPVNKPDGALRVCVDYKATLNPVLLVDRYPLPKIEEVLFALTGSQYYSKIDLSQSYNQIELDESKKYTVINTHRGLFCYNRLVFGLSSSPGIFQRIMTNLLKGIPNIGIFIDDVIIGGKTRREHIEALEAVFERLQSGGLRLKENKCVFLAREVTYLGYVLSKDGIKVDPAKVEAIEKIPRPENVPELRSFLGLANFFAKFVKNYSLRLVPLFNLLKKGVDWAWTDECESAFQNMKKVLASSQVLAHYNPNKALIATCDASAAGIGGVLSQPDTRGVERPVAFVSRTLTSAEKNYSQIHREALAIVFCMRKFHQYLYGRRFTLRTDHKPLVSIFGPQNNIPVMTASRMSRWAVILSAYTYDIEYVRTDKNSADGLSRLPIPSKESASPNGPEQTHLHFAQDALLLDYNEIKKCTARDPLLSRVLSFVRDGWPSECEVIGMQPYFNRRTELYEELGCLMWGHRVVIPEKCRERVLKVLHEPHMGIVKSKALARSYIWWAGVDEAVEALCKGCETCAAQADAPPRQTPRPWPWPSRPWSRVHLDFMGPIFGKTYLVVVDAMSKWLEVFQVPSTAANWTIDKLTELFGRWGLPRQVVSDNGPPFTSEVLAFFNKTRGIEHIFTAPFHPSSNGAAENAVKTLKRVIKKAVHEKQDVSRALNTFLMYYRNTEHTSTGESPAALMLGRRLRTRLDALRPDREARVVRAQQRQVEDAAGAEREIDPGDDVWYRQYLKGEKWLPGKVGSRLGPSNFKVIGQGGNQVHRHVDQLKRRSRSSLVCPSLERPAAGGRGLASSPISETKTVAAESQSERPTTTPPPMEQRVTPESRKPSPELPAIINTPLGRPIRLCRLRKPNYKL